MKHPARSVLQHSSALADRTVWLAVTGSVAAVETTFALATETTSTIHAKLQGEAAAAEGAQVAVEARRAHVELAAARPCLLPLGPPAARPRDRSLQRANHPPRRHERAYPRHQKRNRALGR